MSSPLIPAVGDAFNSPATDDTTSAPSIPQPQISTPLQQLLKNKAKKKITRNPAPLAAQIGRARKARQGGDKWGS